MPTVAGGDQEGIDIRPRQQFGGIAIHLAVGIAVMVVYEALDFFAGALPNVRNGDEAHASVGEQALEVVHPAAANADPPEDQSIVGRDGTAGPRGGRSGRLAGSLSLDGYGDRGRRTQPGQR